MHIFETHQPRETTKSSQKKKTLSSNSMTEIFEKRKGILIFIRFALTPGGKVNEIYKHVKYYILKWIKINKLRKQFEY